MSDLAVSVQGLGKQYFLGVKRGIVKVDENGKNIPKGSTYSKLRQLFSPYGREWFWALKDVSFNVNFGEVIGIIGHNGAGKSTLLKILSRITEPTLGRAIVNGRIGSLLEVGTGFHPELTGRENIYLSGAILGMKKGEIDKKLDEIISFAEVERFIDTPVKRYSSGMYVRLGFAVAAHLDLEILAIDEVLAVGDIAFQKKCLGKMSSIPKDGKTVLFVSHNIPAVLALCPTTILMDHGNIHAHGPSAKIIQEYQSISMVSNGTTIGLQSAVRTGNGNARFQEIQIRNITRPSEMSIGTGDDISIDVSINVLRDLTNANVGVIIRDMNSYRLIDVNTALKDQFLNLREGDKVTVQFCLKDLLIKPGLYSISLWMGRGGMDTIDQVDYSAQFEVVQSGDTVQHIETFLGPYVCKYDCRILSDGGY